MQPLGLDRATGLRQLHHLPLSSYLHCIHYVKNWIVVKTANSAFQLLVIYVAYDGSYIQTDTVFAAVIYLTGFSLKLHFVLKQGITYTDCAVQVDSGDSLFFSWTNSP